MIATGLAMGSTATPALAAEAVAAAMARLDGSHATGVLLFLTTAFAHNPQPALLAASRQSQCLQIAGCSATGIFTEQDWVLDAPAAAAMVFTEPHSLLPTPSPTDGDILLSLAAPNAIHREWLDHPGTRLGGVSGDATGGGSWKVWQLGKIQSNGHVDLRIPGFTAAIGVSHGIRALTRPLTVTHSKGFELSALDFQPALHSLLRELPLEAREETHIPLPRILAAIIHGEPDHALSEGRYELIPVIAIHPERHSLTLASQLPPGSKMFWALRQPLAAEASLRRAIERCQHQSGQQANFAIMVNALARGPGFYNGDDRDLHILRQEFPALPIIGFYGNHQIAAINQRNQLLEYASIFGVFSHV